MVRQKVDELVEHHRSLYSKAETPRGGHKSADAGGKGEGGASPAGSAVAEGNVGKSDDDVRTLWVDYDDHGERFKKWRELSRESFTPPV